MVNVGSLSVSIDGTSRALQQAVASAVAKLSAIPAAASKAAAGLDGLDKRIGSLARKMDKKNIFRNTTDALDTIASKMAAVGAVAGASLAGIMKWTAGIEQATVDAAAISSFSLPGFKGPEGREQAYLITLKKMEDAVFSFSAASKYTGQDVAGAFKYMAMAGLTADTSIAAMGATIRLASASGTELARSADIVTNIMSSYSIFGKDAAETTAKLGDTVNVLTGTFTGANVNLEQLAESFRIAGAIGKTTGIRFEELAATFGVLGNAGIQGADAGQGMKMALINLTGPSRTAAEAQRKLGIGFDRLQKEGIAGTIKHLQGLMKAYTAAGKKAEFVDNLIESFGTRAGPRVATLIGAPIGAIEALERRIKEAKETDISGFLEKKNLETLSGRIKMLSAAAESVIQLIGKDFSGVAKASVSSLKALIDGFNALPSPIQKIIRLVVELSLVFAALIGVVGALALAFNPLLSAVGAVAAAMGITLKAAVIGMLTVFAKIVAVLALLPIMFYGTEAALESLGIQAVRTRSLLDIFTDWIEDITDGTRGAILAIGNLLLQMFRLTVAISTAGTLPMVDYLEQLRASATNAANDFLHAKGLIEKQQPMVATTPWADSWRKAEDDLISFADSFGLPTKEAGKTANGIDDIRTKADALADEVEAAIEGKLGGALRGTKSKIDEVARAFEELQKLARKFYEDSAKALAGPEVAPTFDTTFRAAEDMNRLRELAEKSIKPVIHAQLDTKALSAANAAFEKEFGAVGVKLELGQQITQKDLEDFSKLKGETFNEKQLMDTYNSHRQALMDLGKTLEKSVIAQNAVAAKAIKHNEEVRRIEAEALQNRYVTLVEDLKRDLSSVGWAGFDDAMGQAELAVIGLSENLENAEGILTELRKLKPLSPEALAIRDIQAPLSEIDIDLTVASLDSSLANAVGALRGFARETNKIIDEVAKKTGFEKGSVAIIDAKIDTEARKFEAALQIASQEALKSAAASQREADVAERVARSFGAEDFIRIGSDLKRSYSDAEDAVVNFKLALLAEALDIKPPSGLTDEEQVAFQTTNQNRVLAMFPGLDSALKKTTEALREAARINVAAAVKKSSAQIEKDTAQIWASLKTPGELFQEFGKIASEAKNAISAHAVALVESGASEADLSRQIAAEEGLAAAKIVEAFNGGSYSVYEHGLAIDKAREALSKLGVSGEEAAKALNQVAVPKDLSDVISKFAGDALKGLFDDLKLSDTDKTSIVDNISDAIAEAIEGGDLDFKKIASAIGQLIGGATPSDSGGGGGLISMASSLIGMLGASGGAAGATSAAGATGAAGVAAGAAGATGAGAGAAAAGAAAGGTAAVGGAGVLGMAGGPVGAIVAAAAAGVVLILGGAIAGVVGELQKFAVALAGTFGDVRLGEAAEVAFNPVVIVGGLLAGTLMALAVVVMPILLALQAVVAAFVVITNLGAILAIGLAALISVVTGVVAVFLALPMLVALFLALLPAIAAFIVVNLAAIAIIAVLAVVLGALLAVVFLLVAAIVILVASMVAGFAALAFLLALSTKTKSFERMQEAFEVVTDKIIAALEPFWEGFIALAGLFDVFLGVLNPFIEALTRTDTAARVVFEIFKFLAIAGGYLLLVFGVMANFMIAVVQTVGGAILGIVSAIAPVVDAVGGIGNAFLSAQAGIYNFIAGIFQAIDDLIDGIEAFTGLDLPEQWAKDARDAARDSARRAEDAISDVPFSQIVSDGLQSMMDAAGAARIDTDEISSAIDDLIGLTYEEAKARGEGLRKLEEMNEELTNVPEGFKTANARYRAIVAEGQTTTTRTPPPALDQETTTAGTFSIESLNVYADDPRTMMQQLLEEAMRRRNRFSGGPFGDGINNGGGGGG